MVNLMVNPKGCRTGFLRLESQKAYFQTDFPTGLLTDCRMVNPMECLLRDFPKANLTVYPPTGC